MIVYISVHIAVSVLFKAQVNAPCVLKSNDGFGQRTRCRHVYHTATVCVCVGLFAWLLVMVCRCLFAFRKPKQLHIQSYSFSTSGALKHSECIAVVQSSDLYKQNQNGKNAVAYGVRP